MKKISLFNIFLAFTILSFIACFNGMLPEGNVTFVFNETGARNIIGGNPDDEGFISGTDGRDSLYWPPFLYDENNNLIWDIRDRVLIVITLTAKGNGRTQDVKSYANTNAITAQIPVGEYTVDVKAYFEPETSAGVGINDYTDGMRYAKGEKTYDISVKSSGNTPLAITMIPWEGGDDEDDEDDDEIGDGSSENPWRIRTEADLRRVGTGVDGWTLSAHYRLMNDITFTNADSAVLDGSISYSNWTPIGTSIGAGNQFSGSFNGNNKTITGLVVTGNNDEAGFFGSLSGNGIVKNLNLVNVSIQGENNVGGIAGANLQGTIQNCSVSGSVKGDYNVGGIVGSNPNSINIIENCSNSASVTGITYVGGIVGQNGFFNYVDEDNYTMGGGEISNSHNTGEIKGLTNIPDGETMCIGGIAGVNYGKITDSYNQAGIEGNFVVGGITGGNYGEITNCYNTGDVNGKATDQGSGHTIGGISGTNFGEISNSYNTAEIKDGYNIGGITGNNGSEWFEGTIENCYNTGKVTGGEDNSLDSNAGGIAGINSYGTIQNCYNMGEITSTGNNVGGIAGDNNGTVDITYNTGNVEGRNMVGGIAGSNEDGEITNCVALGLTVKATIDYSTVGRVVGRNAGETELSNNYGRKDMELFNPNPIDNITSDADDKHGEDITMNNEDQTIYVIFVQSAYFNEDIWFIGNDVFNTGNPLPTLRNVIAVYQNPTLP